ncbi:MAG: class II fructose-bisphosphatase [Candidatus Zixiibacteriota bacterium]|nr:MAG: class II fructose-bisphosphatase [candidate division Zixibacteria bacterium]
MDRNLALEIVRATEAAALAAARWMGRGNAESADEAAAGAMHRAFNSISFNGHIVLGDGDKDRAQLLHAGETVGSGSDDTIDIAVDPLECTNSVAFGRTNAMAAVAMAPTGDFLEPPVTYMDKLAVGAEAASVINIAEPIEENLERIAEAKNYSVGDLTVVALDRERHAELIDRVRKTGARIHLIPDGDVAAAVAAALPGTGIDVLVGIGGSVAGILAAAALRCIGGEIQGRFTPLEEGDLDRLKQYGHSSPNRIFRAVDMVRGNKAMFAATGVTDGDMLNGVRYRSDGATTHSVVMRLPSRTRRFIVTEHYFTDNPDY